MNNAMASVAKRLRQRIVVPPFVGSSPIIRPCFRLVKSLDRVNREDEELECLIWVS